MSASSSGVMLRQVPVCCNPIFIIGSQRSGTSILARALGQHSALWYSSEGHVFYRLFDPHRLDEVYASEIGRPVRWIHKEGVTRLEFFESMGMGLNALFTSRSGGKRWIEKTPENTLIVDVLADMFPGSSFVHILRDGRHVVHSMIHMAHPRRWTENLTRACRQWRRYIHRSTG